MGTLRKLQNQEYGDMIPLKEPAVLQKTEFLAELFSLSNTDASGQEFSIVEDQPPSLLVINCHNDFACVVERQVDNP